MTSEPQFTRRNIAPMARRIGRLYASASPTEIREGKAWYNDARRFCAATAKAHGLTVAQVAGIVAALSPMTEWELNKRRALAIVQGSDNVGLNSAKAVAIRDGADPLDVLGGNKVRSFYGAIVKPKGNTVVIDRHAFDIAVGKVNGDDDRKALERKGAYELFSEAYRRAAADHGITPNEMQAVTWVVHRNRAVKFAKRNLRVHLDTVARKR